MNVSSEMEALLTGVAPGALATNAAVDLSNIVPIDIVSPFKSATNAFDITRGIVLSELMLERASYRFGLRQNSTQQFTLRGDSIHYVPGVPEMEVITNTGLAGPFAFTNGPAIAYTDSGDTYYAYNVRMVLSTTGASKRLKLGDDYTNDASGITLVNTFTALEYDEIHVTYGSNTATNYLQTVHTTGDAQPIAIRGRNIDVYVETAPASGTLARWGGVQSFEANWSVTLDADEEFGNSQAVSRDFLTPDVAGNVVVRGETPADLWTKIEQIANTPASETTGPLSASGLQVEIRLTDPVTGSVVKTFYVPDAKFTVPAVSSRVQTKLDTTFSFTSISGAMSVYNGIKV